VRVLRRPRRLDCASPAVVGSALVKPFLERPAAAAPPDRRAALSASGPPLEEVIASLARLRALRTDRAPLRRLRALIA
jgi:hypothetical protein